MKRTDEQLRAEPSIASTVADEPGTIAAPTQSTVVEPGRRRGRRRAFTIFFAVLIIAALAGLIYWLHSRNYESTDDAQIEAHLNPISPRVDGTVLHVYVDNNQYVNAGDPLVDLDPRDYEVALAQAQAQVTQATSMVTAQQPSVPITR